MNMGPWQCNRLASIHGIYQAESLIQIASQDGMPGETVARGQWRA